MILLSCYKTRFQTGVKKTLAKIDLDPQARQAVFQVWG
jgi:hypothetical protein